MCRRLRANIFPVLIVALGLSAIRAQAAVRVDFGRQRDPSTLGSTNIAGEEYVALDDLARVLGAGQFWRTETKKMVLIQ